MKKFAWVFSLLALLMACSKEDPQPQVTEVEYRLSSTTSSVAREVSYVNETGAMTTLKSVALPFSVKFNSSSKAGFALIADIAQDPGKEQSLEGSILYKKNIVENGTSQGEAPVISLSYVPL